MMPAPEDRLLNSNILVHYVREDRLAAWIEQRYSLLSTPRQPLISLVVEGELRALALQFGWGERRLQRLEHLLDHLVKVPLEFEGVIDAYARIDFHAHRTGRPVGENDMWVAATANATGARLLTTDRDFDSLAPQFLNRDWIDPALRL